MDKVKPDKEEVLKKQGICKRQRRPLPLPHLERAQNKKQVKGPHHRQALSLSLYIKLIILLCKPIPPPAHIYNSITTPKTMQIKCILLSLSMIFPLLFPHRSTKGQAGRIQTSPPAPLPLFLTREDRERHGGREGGRK